MILQRSIRIAAFVAAGLAVTAHHAASQELRPVLQRVAAAWHRGDVGTITELSARGGMTLYIERNAVGPVGPRQASAILRRVFQDRESVSAGSNDGRTVGGEPARAFGEIIWTTRARGTTIPERATVFIAFVREGDTWRITEIRLMR